MSCGMIVAWVLVTLAQVLVGKRFYRNAYKVKSFSVEAMTEGLPALVYELIIPISCLSALSSS